MLISIGHLISAIKRKIEQILFMNVGFLYVEDIVRVGYVAMASPLRIINKTAMSKVVSA